MPVLFFLLLIILGFSGWITNLIWTFNQHDVGQIILGILGIITGIIGAVHGIYLWF